MTAETGRERLRREGPRPDQRFLTTGRVDGGLERWFDENWPEYLDAEFVALQDVEPDLARELAERLVDRIIADAGLDPAHRTEALAQVLIEVGVLPDGRRAIMEITLPLGSGRPGYSWDGSIEQGKAVVDDAAGRGVEDLLGDRSMGYPTGWELDGVE